MATVIQRRLASNIDKYIQKTQYGFRAHRSTAQALYLARRIQYLAEQSGMDLCLALLDWEKAFDKVDQQRMGEALERLGAPDKMIRVILALYRKPQFRVRHGAETSQHTRTQIRHPPMMPSQTVLVHTSHACHVLGHQRKIGKSNKPWSHSRTELRINPIRRRHASNTAHQRVNR